MALLRSAAGATALRGSRLPLPPPPPPPPARAARKQVGGAYGDKSAALARFAATVATLSPRCRARLTVENDDRPNLFSVSDLLPLHAACGAPRELAVAAAAASPVAHAPR